MKSKTTSAPFCDHFSAKLLLNFCVAALLTGLLSSLALGTAASGQDTGNTSPDIYDETPPLIKVTTQPDPADARFTITSALASDQSGIVSFRYALSPTGICEANPAELKDYANGQEIRFEAVTPSGQGVCYYATDGAGNRSVVASDEVVSIDLSFGGGQPADEHGEPATDEQPGPKPMPVDWTPPSNIIWQFHFVNQPGVTASQIASLFDLGAGWKVYAWDASRQNWVSRTAQSGASDALPVGETVVFRGPVLDNGVLAAAGLGRTGKLTLEPGWNVFVPEIAIVDTVPSSLGQTSAGGNRMFFPPQLVDCHNTAGVLAIFTFDESDQDSTSGFRVMLPCHPEVHAEVPYPTIEAIDATDAVYVFYHAATSVDLELHNGLYVPVTDSPSDATEA